MVRNDFDDTISNQIKTTVNRKDIYLKCTITTTL
ncbi:MAG: hypothetical protein ACJA0M_002144, partial [Chitinophagales bacterium]